ncbi:hypothetical protein C7N43_23140 [Sphingobacteriales bacterium UPWRP_1]|nr:hypothetical protein BVG80_16470 [Sphingobacteriales bacterium TSM_CSM]PSJ74593.1 hypothetical protein C7N43_23140 [Sphingobacteriales bacterium UPWRP_1]
MKQTFQVAVTKSFLVTIEADNEKSALEYAEVFTSDISDLSSKQQKDNYNFRIYEIENTHTSTQIIKNDDQD